MLNEEVKDGPKIGKPNPYNGMQMPIIKNKPFDNKITKRRLKVRNVQPRLNPSNPVVKGKIINSLGSMSNSKITDNK